MHNTKYQDGYQNYNKSAHWQPLAFHNALAFNGNLVTCVASRRFVILSSMSSGMTGIHSLYSHNNFLSRRHFFSHNAILKILPTSTLSNYQNQNSIQLSSDITVSMHCTESESFVAGCWNDILYRSLE